MAITVTATQGGVTGAGTYIRVKNLGNAVIAGSPATGNSGSSPEAAITTTTAGSVVYGAVLGGSSTSLTAVPGTATLYDNVPDTANNWQYGSIHTAVTGTPGAATVGSSTPAPGNCALLEILSSGGAIAELDAGTIEASSISATTITSPSFTPAAGTMLVALVASGGGSGTVTMTVSDTSGLTWTQRIGNGSGAYAGVWTATTGAVTHTATAAVAETVTIAATGSVSTITLTASASRAETVTIAAAATKPGGQAILAIVHAIHNMTGARPITDLVSAAGTHTGSGGITTGSQLIGMFTGSPSSALNMSTNTGPNALLVSGSYPLPSVTAAQTTPLKTIPIPGRGYYVIDGTSELADICSFWSAGSSTPYVVNNNVTNKGGIVPGGGQAIDGFTVAAGTFVFQFMDFIETIGFASPGPSVLFRGCRFRGGTPAPGFFNSEFGGTWTGNLYIHFCDLGGTNAGASLAIVAIDVEQGNNLRCYRNYISYVTTGIQPNMGAFCDVIQNYIEKLTNSGTSHLNGISVNGGNSNFLMTANHIVIALNDDNGVQVNQTDCISMFQDFGTFAGTGTNSDASVGYWITNNYVGGTGYCFYIGQNAGTLPSTVNNVHFNNNSITTGAYANGGNFGPASAIPTWGSFGNAETGNLWADGASSGASFI